MFVFYCSLVNNFMSASVNFKTSQSLTIFQPAAAVQWREMTSSFLHCNNFLVSFQQFLKCKNFAKNHAISNNEATFNHGLCRGSCDF